MMAARRSNSASVIPDGDWRMLTPAIPAGVSNSKSGEIASVAGEPVQQPTAIDPKSVATSFILIIVVLELFAVDSDVLKPIERLRFHAKVDLKQQGDDRGRLRVS